MRMVWKVTGEIEIHEVTLTERAAERRMQERTQAAQAICQERGWRYIVHTEATLPQATEEANLLALARYRPTAYANPDVTHAVQIQLADGRSPVFFHTLVTEMVQTLHLPEGVVVSAICHLLWHGTLETDLRHHLIFQDAALSPRLLVWPRHKEDAR
jgi:hypothetical protein